MFQQAVQAVSSGPRTILGFLVAVLAIVVTGSFAIVLSLAGIEELQDLVAWILGFDAGLSIFIVGVVLLIAWRDPMRLMLGQVTGEEFLAHRRLVMGDSNTGEQFEPVIMRVDTGVPTMTVRNTTGTRLVEDAGEDAG